MTFPTCSNLPHPSLIQNCPGPIWETTVCRCHWLLFLTRYANTRHLGFAHLHDVEGLNESNVTMLTIFLQDYKLRMSDWKCHSDILVFISYIFFLALKGRGHIVLWVTVSTRLLLNLQWGGLAVTALSWMLPWVCRRSDWGNSFCQLQVIPSVLLPNELPTELQSSVQRIEYFKELLLLIPEKTGICVCFANSWKDSYTDFFFFCVRNAWFLCKLQAVIPPL